MLLNKIIIVVGGSGLIGKSILKYIEEQGGTAINFDLNYYITNTNCEFVKCNVTEPKSISKAIQIVIKKYNRIDGMVNNAYPRTSDWGTKFENIDLDSWRKNIDIQLNSVFYTCQITLKEMEKNKMGSIVNIGSIYGVVGNDFTVYEGTDISAPAAYSAIKGGLINFTRYLASYYGRHNIRVNCVSPGGIFDNQNHLFVENYEKKSSS